MSELLSCPFCGGEAEISQIGNEVTPKRGFEVACQRWGCATRKRAMVIHHPLEEARGFAIAAWNRRAAPASPSEAMVRAASEALAFLESIEGSGYGGMSDYDCAVDSLRSALGASPPVASDEVLGKPSKPDWKSLALKYEADKARLDWLEMMEVEVRVGLPYGSRHLFFASTDRSFEGEIGPSDLRARVDVAVRGEEEGNSSSVASLGGTAQGPKSDRSGDH